MLQRLQGLTRGENVLKERGLVTHTPAAADSPDDHVQHTAADELEKMDLSGMGLVQTKSAILAAENKSPDAASSPTTERLRASKQAYTKRREEVTALAPTNEQQSAPARTESEQALEELDEIAVMETPEADGGGQAAEHEEEHEDDDRSEDETEQIEDVADGVDDMELSDFSELEDIVGDTKATPSPPSAAWHAVGPMPTSLASSPRGPAAPPLPTSSGPRAVMRTQSEMAVNQIDFAITHPSRTVMSTLHFILGLYFISS